MAPPATDSGERGGGGRFAAALRALTGRAPRTPVAPREPAAPPKRGSPRATAQAEPAAASLRPPATSGEKAAARIDAARDRLRATIAVPEDPADDAGDDPRARKRGP